MKKYNTPELKVSMFDMESVMAAADISDTLATYNYYVDKTTGVQTFERKLSDFSITF